MANNWFSLEGSRLPKPLAQPTGSSGFQFPPGLSWDLGMKVSVFSSVVSLFSEGTPKRSTSGCCAVENKQLLPNCEEVDR